MTDIGNIILCQGIKTVSLRLNNFKRPIITAVILNYCGYGVKHYQINPIIRVLWIKCNYMMTHWSILYCLMSRWRKFLSYMVVTIVCKGLRNLDLCSATTVSEQEGDIYRVIPAMTRGLGLQSLIWRIVPFSCLFRQPSVN